MSFRCNVWVFYIFYNLNNHYNQNMLAKTFTTLLMILGFYSLQAMELLSNPDDSTSINVHFSLDSCDAYVLSGTVRDYSEFTGAIVGTGECSDVSIQGTVNRRNAYINTHSCTEGPNGSAAMCVSSSESCDYYPNSDLAIRFRITVQPGDEGITKMESLSFFEQAPEIFSWLDGPSGPNSYPTLFGIRIMKNGSEIYRQTGIETARIWDFKSFNFSAFDAFTIDQVSVFDFEFLAYCTVDNQSDVTAWDIDEIDVEILCLPEPVVPADICFADGSKYIDICTKDEIDDIYEVVASNVTASLNKWLLTDVTGHILEISDSGIFDFGDYTIDQCLVWLLSYEGAIQNLEIGKNASSLVGCFALSNALEVNHKQIGTTTISTDFGIDYVSYCFNENESYSLNVSVNNPDSLAGLWVLTDGNRIVVDVPLGPPFEIRYNGLSLCQLYYLAFDSGVVMPVVGQSIDNISACYSISNAINISKFKSEGGTIKVEGRDEVELCVSSNGIGSEVFPLLTGNIGLGSLWVITNTNGDILKFTSALPISVEAFNVDTCLLWHMSFEGNIAGLLPGNNVSMLSGCLDFSNPITIIKEIIEGPEISIDGKTEKIFCNAYASTMIISPDISGHSASALTWILTSTDNEVIASFDALPIDLTPYVFGSYFLYAVSHDGSLIVNQGENILSLSEQCIAISNRLDIGLFYVEGGTLSLDGKTLVDICKDHNSASNFTFELQDNAGNTSVFILTDVAGTILQLSNTATFSADLSTGSYFVYHMDYVQSISGLAVGQNINLISGCFDLSNGVSINISVVEGGDITTLYGSVVVNICAAEGDDLILNLNLQNQVGDAFAWLITDLSGQILSVQSMLPLDLNGLGNGSYLIWHLSYKGVISGLSTGLNASDLNAECLDLSNSIALNIDYVDGGIISSDRGDVIEVCANDGVDDYINVHLEGQSGLNSIWLLTDASGTILKFLSFPPINIDDGSSGECYIWHLSFSQNLMGLGIGNNVSQLQGCFDLSNSIKVIKTAFDGGILSSTLGSDIEICLNSSSSFVQFEVTDVVGDNTAFVVTSSSGDILQLSQSGFIDLGSVPGLCLVWHISYESDLTGLLVGNSITDVTGCFSLSNSINVNKFIKDAGTISVGSTNQVYICAGDGNADFVDVEISGGDVGSESRWILYNQSNNQILQVLDQWPVDLDGSVIEGCALLRICFEPGVTGLVAGNLLSDIKGCFDLSNSIFIGKVFYEEPESISSSLHFDFEDCYADTKDDSNMDYSEFTAVTSNDRSCVRYTLLDDNLFRNNPMINWHSCTEGFEGVAMCVSSLNSCDYVPDNDLAVRFKVELRPGPNDFGALHHLSFYEQAPETYSWINGPSGPNNYPTLYAVRVLKNGEEIYLEKDIPTNPMWTLQEFDFRGIPGFYFTETSVFEFEMLAYCLTDNGAVVNAWDIDNLNLSTDCTSGLIEPIISTLDGSGTEDVCVNPDRSSVFDFTVLESGDANYFFVLTDSSGNVLDEFTSNSYDFDGFEPQKVYVQMLSFIGLLVSIPDANHIDNFQGCFELSNRLTVNLIDDETCETGGITDEEDEEQRDLIGMLEDDFQLFPNPATDRVQVILDVQPGVDAKVAVFNRLGNKMCEYAINGRYKEIDTCEFPSGFYILQLIDGDQITSKRFLKH